jgi:hypothetical protein
VRVNHYNEKCLACKPSDFDQVYDSQLKEYMDLGGTQVYQDRVAYYREKYGKKKSISIKAMIQIIAF